MTNCNLSIVEGSGVLVRSQHGNLIINWLVTPDRKVLKIGDLLVYLLGMS